MSQIEPLDPAEQDAANDAAVPDGSRAEAIQRLQIGLSGIAAMILLVGLANVIQDRARQTEETSVPQATSSVEPGASSPKSDPLADAGVVPDLPAEPSSGPTLDPALVPEQGKDVQAP